MMGILGGKGTSSAPKSSEHGQESSTSNAVSRKVTVSFWAKRRVNTHRINFFFGEKMQLDVSVAQIKKYGLAAILESNVPLCYFLYYLLDNYCAENLFFYIEVESFENHRFKSKEDLKRTARQLYHCFVREKSDFEVNLESKVIKPIKKAIENGDQLCFSEGKQAIFHLLEPSMVQFTLSPVYTQMVKEIGENRTVYGKAERDAGVDILLKHLDKSLPSEVTGVKSSDQAIAAERTRARLIRNLIHSFCRTRIGCDFWDQEDQKNLDEIKPAQMLAKSRIQDPF